MTSPGLIQDDIIIYNIICTVRMCIFPNYKKHLSTTYWCTHNIELYYSDLYIASILKIITLKNSIENETYMHSVPNDYKEVQELQHNTEEIV